MKPPFWRFLEPVMHRLRHLTLALLIFYAATTSAESRFSGNATLAKPAESSASADGRFDISADLRPAAVTQRSGRFALEAKLQPNAKSIATACGPVADNIFKNGFE